MKYYLGLDIFYSARIFGSIKHKLSLLGVNYEHEFINALIFKNVFAFNNKEDRTLAKLTVFKDYEYYEYEV